MGEDKAPSSIEDRFSLKNIMARFPDEYLEKYTYAQRKAKAIRIRMDYLNTKGKFDDKYK